MGDFVNKLYNSSGLLEDKKLNMKIESLFDNPLFKNIVDKTDVLKGDEASITKSELGQSFKVLDSEIMNSIIKKEARLRGKTEVDALKTNMSPNTNGLSKRISLTEEVGKEFKLPSEVQKKTTNMPSEPYPEIAEKQQGRSGNNVAAQFGEIDPNKIGNKQRLNVESDVSLLTVTDYRRKEAREETCNDVLEDLTDKIQQDLGEVPSVIEKSITESDARFDIESFCLAQDDEAPVDEYEDNDDKGYTILHADREELAHMIDDIKKIIIKEDIKAKRNKYLKNPRDRLSVDEADRERYYLPKNAKFPPNDSSFYPVKQNSAILDTFPLKIVFNRERTGFEESKEFPIVIGSLIAGRYRVLEFISSASFSKTAHCEDQKLNTRVCLKIIENNKDYLDQSLDEIKVLRYLNHNGDPDEYSFIRYLDCFYYKEHLVIVTEMLKDSVLDYYKYNLDCENVVYFDEKRLKSFAWQMLGCLSFIHSLNVIHGDIKPDNILVKSYSKERFKLIDFGSSCFVQDHMNYYTQSQGYRAPEVILGCKYDYKIDVWSLGCVIAELYTGRQLFPDRSLSGVLGKIVSLRGAIPQWMIDHGKLVDKYFTKDNLLLYDDGFMDNNSSHSDLPVEKPPTTTLNVVVPKQSSLLFRLNSADSFFVDFLKRLLTVDPNNRPSAREAMNHPWFRFKQ